MTTLLSTQSRHVSRPASSFAGYVHVYASPYVSRAGVSLKDYQLPLPLVGPITVYAFGFE